MKHAWVVLLLGLVLLASCRSGSRSDAVGAEAPTGTAFFPRGSEPATRAEVLGQMGRAPGAEIASGSRTFLVWRYDEPFCASMPPGLRLLVVSHDAGNSVDWYAYFTAGDPLLHEVLAQPQLEALLRDDPLGPEHAQPLERLRAAHIEQGRAPLPGKQHEPLFQAPS